MIDPLFFLGLSVLLVAVSLTALLVAALPVLQELARAARSADKLFDTLRRDLPPTLEAIRLTGLEITDLTDDVSDGVKSAGQVVKQVDQSLDSAKKQVRNIETNTRSVFAGVKAAWKSLARSANRSLERLPASQKRVMQMRREGIARSEVKTPLLENRPASSPYYEYSSNPERQKPRNPSGWQTKEDVKALDSEELQNPVQEDE